MDARRLVGSVAELRPLVGQEISVGRWFTITQERVNRFADLTGDWQYIHVDPERAAASRFGGTIAHGYLTLALLPLLGREREGIEIALPGTVVNYGLNRVRFPAPVPVGRRVRLRTTIVALEDAESYVQLVQQQTVEVEGQERPGMVAETIVRIYR